MRTPRIETLLIGLVLLVAAGVALAATWVPSIAPLRRDDYGQERAHEMPPFPETNRPERPGGAVQETTHTIDKGPPPISIDAQRATAGVTIVGGIAALVLAVAITRQQIDKATQSCQGATRAGVFAERICAYLRVFGRTAQRAALSATARGGAALQRAWIVARHAASAAPTHTKRILEHLDMSRPYEQSKPYIEAGYNIPRTCSTPTGDQGRKPGADSANVPDATGRVPEIASDRQDRIATTIHDPESHLSDGHLKDTRRETDVQQNPAASFPATKGTNDPDTPLSTDVMTERAAMVIATILDIGEQQGMIRSAITFGEATIDRRRARVRLIIDAHPAEAELLATLPERVQTALPGAQAQWQPTTHAQTVLTCVTPGNLHTTQSGHLLLPVAQHKSVVRLPIIQRSVSAISFLPLRTWRHIGFYGSRAIDTAGLALVGLLYVEAPDALAITIIDQGQISAYYKGAPHLIPMPGSATESLIALGHAMRRVAESDSAVRPLLIVLVEPDAPTFAAYDDLITRLARYPAAPVYTLLVRRRPPETNWRYASVITPDGEPQHATGKSSSEILRIVLPHMRIERQFCACDATFLAAMTAFLRSGSDAQEMPSVWSLVKVS
ncbi:MAG: hypothetical protein ACUVSW_13090 [Roseiflexus sp.]